VEIAGAACFPNGTRGVATQVYGYMAAIKAMTIRYTVVLHPGEEGFAVSCPGLPGCWSQGKTEEESLENIQDAIREYLAAVSEAAVEGLVREVEVTV
jgi:predicted RNase H-like HicB family nuclease